MADDILARNAAGELAVRTTQTSGDIGLNKDDVYTRDAQGRLAVRTTGTGGGGGGASNAADLAVSPAGMEIITSTNAQGAFQQLDAATKILQDQVSVLTTSVDLGMDIGITTTVPLSSLVAMNIDGRPSYKQAGATVYAENGVVGIIDSVDSTNAVITTVQYMSGGVQGNNGIKGDYCTTYGITDMPNGVIETIVGTNNLKIPAGIVLKAAGADTLTTLASETVHETTSTTDFTLFYVGGEMLECGDVKYSETEPSENGTENYQAWFNPRLGKWQFRSNDTGNVWREAIATPLCDCLFTNGSLVRIDFVGYRVLNKQFFGSGEEDIDWTEYTFEMPSDGSYVGWLRPLLDFGALSDGDYRFYFAVAKMATAQVESLPMCEWCIEFKIENGDVVYSKAGMIGKLYGYNNVSVFNSNIGYSFDTSDSTKIRLFVDPGDQGNAFVGCDIPIFSQSAGYTFVAYKSSLLENLGTGAKTPIGVSIFSESQQYPELMNSFYAYQNPLVIVPNMSEVNTCKSYMSSSWNGARYVGVFLHALVKGEVIDGQSYLYNTFGRKVLGYITDYNETFANELEFQWTGLRSGSSVEITKKTGVFANVKKFDVRYSPPYGAILVFDLGSNVEQQLEFIFNLSWFGKGFDNPIPYLISESDYENFEGTIVQTGSVVNRTDFPSGIADGTYVLKATVVNGVVTTQWVLES